MKFVFLLSLLLSIFSGVYADSNGVWIRAEDIQGGIFGSDEASEDFGVAGNLSVTGRLDALSSFFIGGISSDLIFVNENQSNSIRSSMIVDGTISSSDVNFNEIQLRVTGICSPGYSVNSINSDGSVICTPNSGSNTTDEIQGVLPNQGLRVFNDDFGLINTCAPNQILKWSGSVWSCSNDLAIDGDSNPTNEIQVLSIAGEDITLSNGGGTITLPFDDIDDADSDPTNEIQGVLSNQGLRVSGDDFGLINSCSPGQTLKWSGSVWSCSNDLAIDGDSNPTNEIQTIGISGNNITLNNGGGSIILPVDNVNDADFVIGNEYPQPGSHITVSGRTVSLDLSSLFSDMDCGVGKYLQGISSSGVKICVNETSIPAPTPVNLTYEWQAGTFPACTGGGSCGTPITPVTRTVTCINSDSGLPVLDSFCSPTPKPVTTQGCGHGTFCSGGRTCWNPCGDWTFAACSIAPVSCP